MATNYKYIQNQAEKELKQLLLDMDKEEFKEYFKQLIKKYYNVLFTFQNDYSKYYEESNKQYELTINTVKKLLKYEFNNLDNFENLERLKQAEEIAFNQMNTIHFLEDNYSDIVYYNTVQQLAYINSTLSSLIELYKTNPSEALLTVIEDNFTATLEFIKQAKKLPVNEGSLTDYTEKHIVKKEHFKEGKRPSKDTETIIFSVPVFSLYLAEYLDKFFNIMEDLKAILPEEVIEAYVLDLNSSEKVQYYYNLMASGVEKEEALKLTAYLDYVKKENNQGFLYEILDSWS